MPDPKPRRPLVAALAAQAIAAMLAFALTWVLGRGAGISLPLPLIVGGQGVVAAIIGSRLGLAPWWVPIHLIAPGAFAAAMLMDVPAWIFLAAFLGLLLVYWNAGDEQVPLYLTNRTTWRALSDLLPTKEGARFLDLGSGLGGTLGFLARRRPDMTFEGIESAPAPYLLAKIRLFVTPVNLRFGSLWDTNLVGYDVVYCFLSPVPMAALYEKARAEMRPGSLFISNSFAVPDVAADQTVVVEDARQTKLMIWKM